MADASAEHYRWQAFPAREHPGKAVGAMAAIGAIVVLIQLTVGGAGWTLLSAVVLLASLNRFFLPTTFTVDDEGISARYPLSRKRMRWTDLRRFVHDRHGGFLSTRGRPSRLDAFSGMHLLFGPDREAAIAAIRARLPRESAPCPA